MTRRTSANRTFNLYNKQGKPSRRPTTKRRKTKMSKLLNTSGNRKPWYLSKTKWSGILTAVLIVASSPTPLAPVVLGQGIAALLAAFGVRDALDK